MRKYVLNILPLIAAILVLGFLITLFLRGQSVEVQKVERGVAVDAVPATVQVEHSHIVTLSSEEGGRIVESKLVAGQNVQEGDLVVRFDDVDLQLQAEALRDRIQHLEKLAELRMQQTVALSRAKEELENSERLYKAGNYPELEIIRRRREFKAFEENQLKQQLDEAQQLKNLQNQLKRVELRIERCTLHAPSTGTVNRIFAFEGEVINPRGQIAQIHSEKLYVTAKVNEEDFAGVKKGLNATVRLLTYGNRLFPAKVTDVLPGADPETQQYTLFLDIDIAKNLLLPGLSGEASIIRHRQENALLIPRKALLGNSVFVAVNGRAELRPLEIGARGLNQVEVLKGLEVGESVITSGAAELNDGDRIR